MENESSSNAQSYSNISVSGSGKLHAGNVVNSKYLRTAKNRPEEYLIVSAAYNNYQFYNVSTLEGTATIPIGFISGISGLQAICSSIYTRINDSELSSALPRVMIIIFSNVACIKDCLNGLRTLTDFDSISDDRKQLIQLGHIVVSFTNAILLPDELDTVLTQLFQMSKSSSRGERAAFLEAQDEKLTTLIEQLRWQNLAFTLQLAVLES